MKKLLGLSIPCTSLLLAIAFGVSIKAYGESACDAQMANLFVWPTGYSDNALPYDKITPATFDAAIAKGLEEAKRRLKHLKENTDAPTYGNTVEALEFVLEHLDPALSVFYSYLGGMQSEELSAVYEKYNGLITDFENSIKFDTQIFARVDAVYRQRDNLNLTPEQKTLLEKTHLNYVKNGVHLPDDKKARVTAIDIRLGDLSQKFQTNLTQHAERFTFHVTDEQRLEGLPEDAKKLAAKLARKKGVEGFLFSLNYPSYMPFMEKVKDRALREAFWRTFSRRGMDPTLDNRPIVFETVKLREERAKLILGVSATHSDFALAESMAKNVANVDSFLDRYTKAYKPQAEKDLQMMRDFAGHEIEPWDVVYYEQLLIQQKFNFDQEELRPYFQLEKMLEAVFFVANKRHGVKFVPRTDLPTWDKEVRVFEVRGRGNKYLGLYYLDPFTRPGLKGDGAWNQSLRQLGMRDGMRMRPHIVNVSNINPGTAEKPALLSLDDVTTLFHEMGHALHILLGESQYTSLAGTNVSRDFVEFPSQLNEEWKLDDEVLDRFARHYLTNERVPQALIAKVKAAKNFMAGYYGLRRTMSSVLDMAWHSGDLSSVRSADDIETFERTVLRNFEFLPRYGSLYSPSNDHIFAGGYASYLYSYQWADVYVENAARLFRERGMYHEETSRCLDEQVISRGGTENEAVMICRFLGGEPDFDAVLKRDGIIP